MPVFEPEDGREWAAANEPLLILDGVGNPHNLGAIVRSAAFFGLQRILVSDNPEQALPSDASHRVARGGMAHVEIVDAGRIDVTLQQLKPHYLVIGTGLGHGGRSWRDIGRNDLRPRAIVLGNEEQGLDEATLAACDVVLTIPGSGAVQSLNVAATAAILIHLLAGDQAATAGTKV
jgi:TrmH RNA methyltransferase